MFQLLEQDNEEIFFLLSNSSKYSRKELTDLFNEKHGTNISVKSITNKCNSYKSYGKAERHLVGDEVTRSDGYVIVKVSNDKNVPKYKRWVLKHRLVWEKEFGAIPDGHVLIFRDGDRGNCDISNLVLVKREIATIMSRNSMFSDNEQLNDFGINIAKAVLVLAEKERGIYGKSITKGKSLKSFTESSLHYVNGSIC